VFKGRRTAPRRHKAQPRIAAMEPTASAGADEARAHTTEAWASGAEVQNDK